MDSNRKDNNNSLSTDSKPTKISKLRRLSQSFHEILGKELGLQKSTLQTTLRIKLPKEVSTKPVKTSSLGKLVSLISMSKNTEIECVFIGQNFEDMFSITCKMSSATEKIDSDKRFSLYSDFFKQYSNISLSTFLKDPICLKWFTLFLKSKKKSSLLDFYLMVQMIKGLNNDEKTKKQLDSIKQIFFPSKLLSDIAGDIDVSTIQSSSDLEPLTDRIQLIYYTSFLESPWFYAMIDSAEFYLTSPGTPKRNQKTDDKSPRKLLSHSDKGNSPSQPIISRRFQLQSSPRRTLKSNSPPSRSPVDLRDSPIKNPSREKLKSSNKPSQKDSIDNSPKEKEDISALEESKTITTTLEDSIFDVDESENSLSKSGTIKNDQQGEVSPTTRKRRAQMIRRNAMLFDDDRSSPREEEENLKITEDNTAKTPRKKSTSSDCPINVTIANSLFFYPKCSNAVFFCKYNDNESFQFISTYFEGNPIGSLRIILVEIVDEYGKPSESVSQLKKSFQFTYVQVDQNIESVLLLFHYIIESLLETLIFDLGVNTKQSKLMSLLKNDTLESRELEIEREDDNNPLVSLIVTSTLMICLFHSCIKILEFDPYLKNSSPKLWCKISSPQLSPGYKFHYHKDEQNQLLAWTYSNQLLCFNCKTKETTCITTIPLDEDTSSSQLFKDVKIKDVIYRIMFQNNGSCLVGTNFGKAFYIYQDKLFSIGVSKESLIITTLECYEDIIYLGCCKGSVTAYQKNGNNNFSLLWTKENVKGSKDPLLGIKAFVYKDNPTLWCYSENKIIGRDINTGSCIIVLSSETIDLPKSFVSNFQNSFDSNLFVISSIEHEILLIKFFQKTAKIKCRYKGHTNKITALKFNDYLLCAASVDKSIRIWRIKDGKVLMVCEKHEKPITTLFLTQTTLYSGDESGKVFSWQLGEVIVE